MSSIHDPTGRCLIQVQTCSADSPIRRYVSALEPNLISFKLGLIGGASAANEVVASVEVQPVIGVEHETCDSIKLLGQEAAVWLRGKEGAGKRWSNFDILPCGGC